MFRLSSLIVLELAPHKRSEQAGGVGRRWCRSVNGARLLVRGVANERIAVKLVGWLRWLLLLLLRHALLSTWAAVQLEETQQARGAIVTPVNWPCGKPRRVLGLVHGRRRGRRSRRVIVGAVLRRVRLIYVLLMLMLLLMVVGSLLVVAVVRVELRAQIIGRGLLLLLLLRLLVMMLVLRSSSRRIVALMAAGLLRMLRVLALELGEEGVERAVASGTSAIASHD